MVRLRCDIVGASYVNRQFRSIEHLLFLLTSCTQTEHLTARDMS